MRAALTLAALLALAACATVLEDDGLLASTPIVRALEREDADVVEVARFSRMRAGTPLPADWLGWGLRSGKRRTDYRLVQMEGDTVLQARSDASAAGTVEAENATRSRRLTGAV